MKLSERIHSDREAKRARQANKPPPTRMVMNPEYAYLQMLRTLGRSNVTPAGDIDVEKLTTGPLAQLERLRTGVLDASGFVEIAEACSAAAELASDIWDNGTADTRSQIEAVKPELMATGDAIASLALRHSETGRWVAKAEELQIIRTVLAPGGYYEMLIRVADRGAICRALEIAAAGIQEALRVKK